MHKIFVVASTEFGSAIRTKAFLVSLLMLPIIWGSAAFLQLLSSRIDTKTREFVVVDRTGQLGQAILTAANARNAAQVGPDGKLKAPRFEPRFETKLDGDPAQLRLALSDRIREGKVFAFVEVPARVLDPDSREPATLLYHSDNPNYDDLRNWITFVVGAEVRTRRYRAAGIDPALAAKLERPIESENLGLLSRSQAAPAPVSKDRPAAGGIREAEKVDRIRTFAVPAVLLFLMFMIVMSTAPQLLNSVIEEKMSRISEVLLGSVSPFELMLGKLLGNVSLALLLAFLYVGAAYGLAAYYGYADAVSPALLVMLCFFLVLAIFFYGSLYMAVGSACSELKDAQSLMMPVLILSMLPMFVWIAVITNPSGPVSVGMSLFPPASPFLMLTRMALRPAPPLWQVVLSVVLTVLTSLGAVWAAGKVFRTGLLMQGKAPSFAEMTRWVMAR
jgi:ABC-type Na+ efflux pump permease subunit